MADTQTERAYARLRTEILNGLLQPGFPLLEVELAERLGMSRTPVRAAVARLKSEGFVETIRRKGVFVRPLTPDDVEQMYEMMEGLEGMAVKLAAARATDEEIEELLGLGRTLGRAALEQNLDEWSRADAAFHKVLHRVARNQYIAQQMQQLELHVERVRWLLFKNKADNLERSAAEHRAMVEALAAREGERARLLHQAHWQRVRQEIVEILRQSALAIPRLNTALRA